MSLSDLKNSVSHDQEPDEETREPVSSDDQKEAQEPRSWSLACTVYYNPAHPIAEQLAELEANLLAEIHPRYLSFDFEPLSEDSLRTSSMFSTRAAETEFLRRGFAHAPGLWPVPAPAPRRRAGNTAHQRSFEESKEALRVLALTADRVLRSVKELMPRQMRPAWLNRSVPAILAPVCGKVSRPARADTEAPDIPIVRADGLLFGCTKFDEQRTVLPSYISTPRTAEREGRAVLKRWSEAGRCDLYADSLSEQIRRELSDPVQHFGADFDLAAAALWICQCVMQMRLSVEDVKRRNAASWYAYENKKVARWVENRKLLNRLFEGYEEPGENSIVEFEHPTLTRRILEIFYGVAFDTWDDYDINNRKHRALVQTMLLIHWLRQLRLTGRAKLDQSLALHVCDLVERKNDDFPALFSGPEGKELDDWLSDLLPKAGWQALYDAGCVISEDPDAVFEVNYGWRGLAERGPQGHVHQEERRIEIVGPLLMLPLHAADYWRDKAREIPADGMYAFARRRK